MKNLASLVFLVAVLYSCNSKSKLTQEYGPKSGVICGGASPNDTAWYSSNIKAPLFDGLEGINFPVTTSSKSAQQYFNQGVMLAFAFNHAEAARSFWQAAREDSTCAMCWWGFAYVLGPNYNMGMDPGNFERAYVASQKAVRLSGTGSELEKDLIHALSFRYSADANAERPPLDSMYSVEMRKLYAKYKDNATIAAMFAESIMDLHPWNLWDKKGNPHAWTPEITKVLEDGLAKDSLHPGVNHFYVHAMEQSYAPAKALPSANRLLTLVPGAGHLVHMPAHIFIHTGQYHEGTMCNIKATQVDSAYKESCHAQGAYPLAYYPHNHHFIAACGALEGNSKHALYGAKSMEHLADKKLMKEADWATLVYYYTMPLNVMIKFALWDSILQAPAGDTTLLYAEAVRSYARGMAYLGKNDVAKSKAELARFKKLSADSSLIELSIWGINKLTDVLAIASLILEGEITAKEKQYDKAIALLTEAKNKEDLLNYNEPPDWFLSARHHLGALQTEAGKYKDAAKTYEEDLKVYPENGWALQGLYQAQLKSNQPVEAQKTKQRFDKAWAHADVSISSSRIW